MDSSKPTGKVILLQDSLPVGKGAVVEGELSHGHAIPAGSVSVVVEEIEDGICDCSSAFDDEFIVSEQFVYAFTCVQASEIMNLSELSLSYYYYYDSNCIG